MGFAHKINSSSPVCDDNCSSDPQHPRCCSVCFSPFFAYYRINVQCICAAPPDPPTVQTNDEKYHFHRIFQQIGFHSAHSHEQIPYRLFSARFFIGGKKCLPSSTIKTNNELPQSAVFDVFARQGKYYTSGFLRRFLLNSDYTNQIRERTITDTRS